jgi:hypothetical protein
VLIADRYQGVVKRGVDVRYARRDILNFALAARLGLLFRSQQ